MKKEKVPSRPNRNPLWTRDFTIITLGSVVSMFGNSMSSFAMSLMVLDLSKSTLLYAVFIAMYTAPMLFMPIISGAILDRFSRKKMIYTLDFISAFLYLAMAVILAMNWFPLPAFAVFCFILGTIESTYMVAYDSFYPLLITEGNYQKAYSIASVLETVSAVMIPISAVLYHKIGLAPLMAANAVCFFIAAVMETKIGAEEKYIEKQKANQDNNLKRSRQVMADIKEGFAYLRTERGLLAVAVFFAFTSVCQGVSEVITLPYFKGVYEDGEFWYMMVWGMNVAARMIGGMFHYRKKIPPKYRYGIALASYIIVALMEGTYLFLPIPLMMLFCFLMGIGGVTSFTIRVSATQSYVPDEKKGRFNGAFTMLSTGGALLGQFAAGTLTLVLPERVVLLGAMLICAAAAIVLIGGGKKEVSRIYNRSE